MIAYVRSKAIHMAVVLFFVTFGVSSMLRLIPGEPAYSIIGPHATPEQVEQVNRDLNLDGSVFAAYGSWLKDLAQGDFGKSFKTDQPVTEVLMDRAPVTFELALLALVIAFAVAIPIGILTAYFAGSWFDRVWTVLTANIVAIPSFVAALVLIHIFAIQLRDFPVNLPALGWVPLEESVGQNLRHMLLPAMTASLPLIANFSRLLRADLVTILNEDFVLAARARGVPTRRILLRYALRPASTSLIAFTGVAIAILVNSAIVTEVIFALPGIGNIVVSSIVNTDILMVQGCVMFIAIVYVAVNALLDVVSAAIDPRIRVARAA